MSNKPLLSALFTGVTGAALILGALGSVDESVPNARRNKMLKYTGMGFIAFCVILATILNLAGS